MNKLKFVFSAIVFSAGLVITTLAQAETIKIGVSFRMLSDVGYKHGELITYRAIQDDPEYLVNWVDKLGLLCESHQRIGFLGSSYFIGVVIALMFVPALSDRIGRREMFCITLLVSIAAQIGLMWSNSLNISFAFMIILGLTWPGKRVTGITYFLEFIPAQY